MSVLTVPMKQEYIIGPDTMLILPLQKDNELYSRVIEMNQEFICSCKPLDIIKSSCFYYGSSYEGRRDGTIALTNGKNKTPIMISQSLSLFYFPTSSIHKPDCIWISLDHVLFYKKAPNNTSMVTFRNKINYELDVSPHIFNNQMLKTTHLKNLITRRIEEMLEPNNPYWKLSHLKEILAFERMNAYHAPVERIRK